jgi:hypothetical protein
VPPDRTTLSRLPQGGSSAVVNAGDAIDVAEMRELVIDAWTIVMPKRLPPNIYVIIRRRLRPSSCPGVREDNELRALRIVVPIQLPTRPTASAFLTAEADGRQL